LPYTESHRVLAESAGGEVIRFVAGEDIKAGSVVCLGEDGKAYNAGHLNDEIKIVWDDCPECKAGVEHEHEPPDLCPECGG
jgi:rubrerythrin